MKLKAMGLCFIVTIKTIAKGFPMHHLSCVELPGSKGDCKAKDDDGAQMLAMAWANRDRRDFILTCSSRAPGSIIQGDDGNSVIFVEHVAIRQMEVSQTFHSGCATINEHDRHCQEHLNLKKKTQVVTWDQSLLHGSS